MSWADLQASWHPELKLLFAIPNGAKLPYRKTKGGKRYSREGLWLKQEGLKPGVPDLCLPVARNGYHGLYIELKFGKNRPTLAQKEWLKELNKQGYLAVVCYGFDAAKQVIEKYLDI